MPLHDNPPVEPVWWRELEDDASTAALALLSLRLEAASERAQDEQRRMALDLLARAASPILRPDNWQAPFAPMAIFQGRRSVLPEDFEAHEISLLRQLAATMDTRDNPSLRARVSDICWTYGDRGDIAMLHMAIESYTDVPLEADTWLTTGRDEWHRGLELVIRRGAGGKEQLETSADRLLNRLRAAKIEDGFFAVELSSTARKYSLAPKGLHTEFADRAVRLADVARRASKRSIETLWEQEAEAWYHSASESEKVLETRIRIAASLAAEATDRRSSNEQLAIAASHYVEEAIKVLLTLPRGFRRDRGIDATIAALRTELANDRRTILEAMRSVPSPPVDLKDSMADAREAVSGVDPVAALVKLGAIFQSVSIESMIERAEKATRSFPSSFMFGTQTLASSGQKVASHPGIDLSASRESSPVDPAIWHAVIRDHGLLVKLVTQGRVIPALEVVAMQHQYRIEMLFELCRKNPWLPVGYELIWARGLLHGLNFDFASAAALLVPMIEHFVRHHLKLAGQHTLLVAEDGTETEKGLTALLEDSAAKVVLGEDLHFELQALLTDSAGPNLRNTMAHGLAPDALFYGESVVYAWWLALRFATSPFREDSTDATSN